MIPAPTTRSTTVFDLENGNSYEPIGNTIPVGGVIIIVHRRAWTGATSSVFQFHRLLHSGPFYRTRIYSVVCPLVVVGTCSRSLRLVRPAVRLVVFFIALVIAARRHVEAALCRV
jgi:hypothetical protein